MARKTARTKQRDVPSRLFLVRFGASTARILGSVPGTIPAPRRELRAPVITPATFTRLPPRAGEYWAALYDAERRPIAVYGWPLRPRYFVDAPNVRSKVPGALKGGLAKPCFDDRLLHLEVPREAAYLLFLRARVVPVKAQMRRESPAKSLTGTGPYGPVRMKLECMGAYSLRGGASGLLKTPIKFPCPLDSRLKEFIFTVRRLQDLIDYLGERFPVPRGWIVSEETVHYSGDPATHFNIVITGDGFKEEELPDFARYVDVVIDGLKTTKPFSELMDRINIHVIHAASILSGVYSASDPVLPFRDSYYGVRRGWPDPTLPADYDSYDGYCGISDAAGVYDAAKNFAPPDQIQLFIMLVNCDTPGGSAFHDQRIAFVTAGNKAISENYLAWTAEHESAHVIGNLCEEYISPLPWDGITTFSNVIDREHREEAWWKPFAETTSAGKFKHVYDCPDEGSTCELAHNDPYLTASGDPGHLGLYWGGQFVDPDEDIETLLATWEWDSPWWDKRGNNFFRPRARCRMRSLQLGWVFCEVCSAELTRIITDPSS